MMRLRAYGDRATVDLYDHHLVIKRSAKGFFGQETEQFVPFTSIKSVVFRRPAFMISGRIVLTLASGRSTNPGTSKDDNTVFFDKSQVQQFEQVLHAIQMAIAMPSIEQMAMSAMQRDRVNERVEQGRSGSRPTRARLERIEGPPGSEHNPTIEAEYEDLTEHAYAEAPPFNPTAGGWWSEIPLPGKIVIVAVSLFLLLAFCSQGDDTSSVSSNSISDANDGTGSTEDLTDGEPTQYHMRSNVAGASMVTLDKLSPTTRSPKADADCTASMQEAVSSPGSRIATALGWTVLQEAKVGKLDAVLISRGSECTNWILRQPISPNIAFFEGERLVGVLYPKGRRNTAIDLVSMTVQDGKLKIIGSGVSGMVQGQVSTQDDITYSFNYEAGEDTVCSEKYRVPTTSGKPYGIVRQMYIDDGWVPTQQPREDDLWSPYQDIYPELSGCIPTGTGECFFELKAKNGPAILNITTSDWPDATDRSGPLVHSYDVMCDGKPS